MSGEQKPVWLGGHRLDALGDLEDERDYFYKPPLIGLAPRVDPRGEAWWSAGRVRNQEKEPSCTGHALAAIVDHLRARDLIDGRPASGAEGAAKASIPAFDSPWASWRMLYGVARFHDEWLGEDYSGSSIRGAVKGFYYNGVCSTDVEPKTMQPGEGAAPFRWHMTRAVLESARVTQLGAYYSVRPRLADLHAALNETGLVLASADIHQGWLGPHDGSEDIPFDRLKAKRAGKHAFVIIGYDDEGLLIQNSWSAKWGKAGIARWLYDDWSANVVDMWVLRLAASFPERRDPSARPQFARNRAYEGPRIDFANARRADAAPSRLDVIGHMMAFADGRLDTRGHYHADFRTLKETFELIRGKEKYRHVLLHFTGAKRDEDRTAAALRDALPVFKENGVYPIFITPEAALAADLYLMTDRVIDKANRTHGERPSDAKDIIIEGRLSQTACRLRREIEQCARWSFARPVVVKGVCDVRPGDAVAILNAMFATLAEEHQAGDISYHLSAHGAGAHFLAGLCAMAHKLKPVPIISSMTLLAPMIGVADVNDCILPLLRHPGDGSGNRRTRPESMEVGALHLACLSAEADREDTYRPGYSKSWPRLWEAVYDRARHDEAQNGVGGSETDEPAAPRDERLLAIETHAREFVDALAGAHGVALEPLGSPARPHPSLTHEGLENRAAALDFLLACVLGAKKASPTFAQYYGVPPEGGGV